jgi:hypothetical protein
MYVWLQYELLKCYKTAEYSFAFGSDIVIYGNQKTINKLIHYLYALINILYTYVRFLVLVT